MEDKKMEMAEIAFADHLKVVWRLYGKIKKLKWIIVGTNCAWAALTALIWLL